MGERFDKSVTSERAPTLSGLMPRAKHGSALKNPGVSFPSPAMKWRLELLEGSNAPASPVFAWLVLSGGDRDLFFQDR
jgi:hypothetical protein